MDCYKRLKKIFLSGRLSHFLLVLFELAAQCIGGLVGSLFKGFALLRSHQFAAGDVHFDFGNFVLFAVVVIDFQIHLAVDDAVVVLFQFVEPVLDKMDELFVGVEIDGLNTYFHRKSRFCIAPRVGLVIQLFQLGDVAVGVNLRGGEALVPE